MIHVECPSCRQPLSIPDEYAGKSGRCNYCAEPVQVPAAGKPPSVDSALGGPYSAPRRPARPGAGMIANEAEHTGGAGTRLVRIAVIGVLTVVVVACVLPAVVLGFTAENKPPEETRPRSMPVARGTEASASSGVATSLVNTAAPSPSVTEDTDRKAMLFATAADTHFHKAGCPHLGTDAQALTLDVARARGLDPCPSCAE